MIETYKKYYYHDILEEVQQIAEREDVELSDDTREEIAAETYAHFCDGGLVEWYQVEGFIESSIGAHRERRITVYIDEIMLFELVNYHNGNLLEYDDQLVRELRDAIFDNFIFTDYQELKEIITNSINFKEDGGGRYIEISDEHNDTSYIIRL